MPALATTIVNSNGTAASVNITVASAVKASATVDSVSGSGGAAYNNSNGVAATAQNWVVAPGLLTATYDTLNLGAVTSTATGSTSGLATATGTSTIANANTSLQVGLLGIPVIGLGVTGNTINSTTTVSQGSDGLLHASGSSNIAGLGISGTLLGSLTLDLSALANAAANTTVLSIPGLKLIFNEQLTSGDGVSDLFMQTNAVHLTLSDFLYNGSILNGDVVLGHSQAQISAVPEPATWGMMIVGFGAVGFAMRRSRTPASQTAASLRGAIK